MWTKQKLGVAAWTMGQRPLPDISQRIQDLNYDGLTLTIHPERDTAVAVIETLHIHNLSLFAIAPPEVDVAHPDMAVRQQAIATYLKLVDFAAEVGQPLVIVRGMKGRNRPLTSLDEEMGWLETAVSQIAAYAAQKEVRLAIEVLNRYESHLINTGAAAMQLVDTIGLGNVGVMLNAFHMNIEEQDAATVMRQVGDRLWLFAMSDSNRRAIGQGHIKLGNHLWALEDIGYSGPIILECLPPGQDPFSVDGAADSLEVLESYLRDSRSWF
jgi:D-psicose/D-tagatose/L-ribulose 3-epimerase